MDKSKRSQLLKLSVIASLFITTPLIPTMLRSPYLYFIFNLLIVALGADAGLLSFFSKSGQDKKHVNTSVENPRVTLGDESNSTPKDKEVVKPVALVEKCASEKNAVEVVRVVNEMKKCPSTPSIFFIGNGEEEPEDEIWEGEEEEDEELYTKAEMFIGNFYKQLQMQRQDSWNRNHKAY